MKIKTKLSNKNTAKIVGALILFAYAVLASSAIESKIIVMLAEALSGVAVITIAILMLPFFKPFGKKLSLSYLFFRGLEGGAMIIAGLLFLSSNSQLLGIRDGIYAIHGYIFAIAALFFYYLLYKSKIIPKWLSVWGFIASILLVIVMLLEAVKIVQMSIVLYLPIILNEVVLAAWLIIKGFNKKE